MATKTRRSGAKTRRSGAHESVHVRGFARMQIGERDRHGHVRIVGDSGWFRNTITNEGRDNYLAKTVGALSGSKTPTHLQVATQSTAVDATQTSLVGETRIRKTLTASVLATGTLRMTASWSSTDNTAAVTIGTIAVYNTSAAGSMGSGQTYATSVWNSNQDLSSSYEWRFVWILAMIPFISKIGSLFSMLGSVLGVA